MIRAVAGAALALGAAAALLSGAQPFGKAALSAGLPSVALPLLADGPARATALHRLGRYAEAAEAFRAAGDRYNASLAAAWAGDYTAALADLDARLAEAPDDRQAQANYDLLAGHVAGTGFDDFIPMPERDKDGPVLEAEVGQGTGRASSTGSDTSNPTTGFQMPELVGMAQRSNRRQFDAQYLRASERWLDTMPDEPGLYLKARLEAEQDARRQDGTALPPAEDPR